jgi:hypothetical protein
MEAPADVERPVLGPQGEPCPECGAPLARDQRYCLTCGARRTGIAAVLSAEPRRPGAPAARAPETVVAAAPVAESPWRLDAGLLAGVGCLLLALLVGVLIGRSGNGDPGRRAAAAPQVVTLAPTPAAGTGATGGTTPVAFHSDWPAGKRGFTVELQTLPKAGTDAAAVAAAKQAAAGKGAPGVGALDSDAYSSLPGGKYVVYSGQYADRKAAQKALAGVEGAFPGAKVVEVSDAGTAKGAGAAAGASKGPSAAEQAAGAKAIQDIQNSSGSDYSKKSAQLPDKLATPGKLPPKDTSKPAGGGSQTETFK